MIFQKSYLDDLYNFTRLKKFKNLLIKDRFNLCADIKIAIKDIHCNDNILLLIILTTFNQMTEIVYEDIKSQNVLVFEEKS